MIPAGQIVILNGAPRSGKSSIARALQDSFDEPWLNLGVDTYMQATPERFRPGVGLRPGGERPDLEPLVERMYLALYDSVAAHSRLQLNVVVDVGHHDDYSTPRAILPKVAARLAGLPALLVGVRCPIEVIMRRRELAERDSPGRYLVSDDEAGIPAPVERWQRAVHQPGIYDMEVDSSARTPQQCASAIRARLESGPTPTALERLALSPGS